MSRGETVAFIGAGNMATSLVGGLVADGYAPQHLWVTNPSLPKLETLQQQFKVNITQDNLQAVASAEIIVLAIKPQKMQAVLRELSSSLGTKLLISVAAGIPTTQLQTWLGNQPIAIIRCMPNTPALIGAGVTGMYATPSITPAQKALAESIMQAVGSVLWVDKEEQIDIVAALSGSGPAYFFRVMEALQAGAEKLGLSSDQANMLTLQTALGAAKMAAISQESLKTLREQVTSPGGMTAKAISALEAGGIDQLFYAALCAGRQRAQEMAEELKG